MEDRRASHLRSSPSCFHRTSMSWIICKVSMSCRRSVRPAQWGERTRFQWVLQPQPRPCPCVPRLCLSSAHPPGAAVPRAPPPRAIQHDGGKGSQGPSGPSLGPSLGPGWLTVPVLKDDAHAAVTACLLVAVHDPQRLHLGVHERALLHAAGHTAVRGRASARPGGRGALAGGPRGLTRLQPAGCWGQAGTAGGRGPPSRSPGACTGASAPWSGASWSSGSSP